MARGICHEHWPDGWPAHTYTAVCLHDGERREWERAEPKARKTPPEKAEPEAAPEE